MNTLIVAVFCLLLGLALAIIWMKRRKDSEASGERSSSEPSSRVVSASAPEPEPLIVMPAQVVVTDGNQEVMSMTLMEDADAAKRRLGRAIQLPQQAIKNTISRLIEPLMQVAPSAGTAAMANNSRLMEVVINGQMLAASDGNGFRAIAKAGQGFEHGRLYEPKNLQNIANAAAIWQIASVVVAQKHLADISASLKRVESKVDGIQSFLEEARLATIRSAMNYLEVAKKAVESGEFLERTRGELERFDIELDRVGMALQDQIERESVKDLERDSVGCEGEYQSALAKHRHLSRQAGELVLCQEVRLANWYLCSLYPDRSKVLTPRLEQIKKAVAMSLELKARLSDAMDKDCSLIDATFTSDKVINERRSEVRHEARKGHTALLECHERSEAIFLKIESVRTDHLATNRLIVDARDGGPLAVYLCPNGTHSGSFEPAMGSV
jgi:hypothetical protein